MQCTTVCWLSMRVPSTSKTMKRWVKGSTIIGRCLYHVGAASLRRFVSRFGSPVALPEASPTAMPLLQRLALAALPAALLGLAACDRGPATVPPYMPPTGRFAFLLAATRPDAG